MAQKKKMSDKVDKRYKTYVTVDGQKVWVTAKTKQELERKKKEVRQHLRDGYDPNYDVPFVQVIAEWYRVSKEPNIKSPNTKREYQNLLNVHIYPNLNKRQMCKAVTHSDLQKVLSSMKGYNTVSINLVNSILKKSCQYAIANGYMEHDPSTALVKPMHKQQQKRDALTQDQVDRMIDVSFQAGRDGLIFFLLYFLGLRINEATALTWGDIDWQNDVVHISKSLIRDSNSRVVVSTTKTQAGVRDVPLPSALREILKPYREMPTEYILRGTNGKPLFGTDYRNRFFDLLYKAGLTTYTKEYQQYLDDKSAGKKVKRMQPQYEKSITAHWLRHNYVTMMFDAEIPAEVASRFAGHSSYQVTADIYTHIRDERKKKESMKLDAMFSKNLDKTLTSDDKMSK